MTSAIIAFGSLISEAGDEISAATIERRHLEATSFYVEFARKSQTRSDGPTLVPVTEGGAQVRAVLLVLDGAVSIEQAQDMLYRREARQPGATYAASGQNWVKDDGAAGDLEHCLYTALPSNISPLTAERLAELAIASAAARDDGKDGISYLIDALEQGIETPLSGPYTAEVLRHTGARTLEEAWEQVRRGVAGDR